MSAEQLITQHINTWTSALQTRSTAGRGNNGKIDLYGIKKLRELILELAVRGKLVPQDPNDEPASELLKRIAAEKAEMVKQGKIKKQKPLAEISEDEKPFELPVGWGITRLGNIAAKIGSGSTPRGGQSSYVISGIPFLRSQNIWNDNLKLDDVVFISDEVHSQMEGTQVQKNDILLNITGASLGRCAIFPESIAEANVNQHVTIIRLIDLRMVSFVHLAITSPVIQKIIWGRQVGMAIEGLSKKTLELFEIPTPPLPEQLRIIEKVRGLMSLCDQLEQQSLTSLEAHSQLVDTLLATLANSQDAEELAENWARISQHFDTLFTTQASIDALKQTILQLAVMGKLVPQDPNDEPASELLKRIEQEKAQLVKEGKIKKQKPLPPISDEEKKPELPVGWIYSRVDNLFNIIIDCPHSTAKFEDNGILCIDTNTFKQGALIKSKFRFVSQKTYEERILRLKPEGGDIVLAREGSVGESVVIPDNLTCCLGQRVMLLRPSKKMNAELLRYFLSSKNTLDQLLSLNKGIGAKHVNVKDVKHHVIAVPPVAEQNAIYLRIQELYVLCDSLKSNLQSAQQTQLHLADALTDTALS